VEDSPGTTSKEPMMQNAQNLQFSTGTHSFPKTLRVTANPTLVHKSDHRVFQIFPLSKIY
jgi:hypothetical protein